MKRKVLLIAGATVALWLAVVPTASAGRWSLGNGPTDLDVSTAVGFASGNICTTHIHGRAGLSTDTDPAVTQPPQPPYSPLTVRIYIAPGGTLAGSTEESGGMRTPAGKLVKVFRHTTTVAPTQLTPPEEYFDFQDNPIWEYAAAPFQFTIPAGKIPVGDDVLINQPGRPYLVLRAVACNQASWRGKTWNIRAAGDALVTRTSTNLTVDLGMFGTGDPTATYFTDCTFTGNFDAHVHYTLNTWPVANATRVGLLVNNPTYPSPNGSVTVERTSYAASGDVGSGENYVINAIDAGGGFLDRPTAATSGDLRVSQVGNTMTAYVRDASTANKYVQLGTSPAYSGPVSLGLQVWSGIPLFNGPIQATFSGFGISKGTCS